VICKWHHTPAFVLILAILSLAFIQGCDLASSGEQPNPTLTALSAAIARTATAANRQDSSTDSLATAQAKATARSEEIFATQTAQLASRDEVQLATATVAAPILAELPQYGLDPESGQAAWVHNPLTLELTAYHDFTYGNDYMQVTARDFVLAADINWDTQYGGSGCGFMFRSDGDQNNPNQYMVIATRFANGRVIFSALADGEIANIHDFYPKDRDRSFEWQNGTTNRLAVVARGNIIEIYTNGIKIGEVDTTQPPKQPVVPAAPQPPTDQTDQTALKSYQAQLKEYEDISQQARSNYQIALNNYKTRQAVFEDGFLAMIALSESGHTVCNFDKAWLWLLEP
jgi:hypothetical protein